MRNLILALALLLFGCTQAEQSQIYDMTEIDSTNYRDIPWWPVFEAQILPTLKEPIVITVDESEFGYTVNYRDSDEYGQLFFACPNGLLAPHFTIQQYHTTNETTNKLQ